MDGRPGKSWPHTPVTQQRPHRWPARGDGRRDVTRRIQVKLEGNTPDWQWQGGGGWRRLLEKEREGQRSCVCGRGGVRPTTVAMVTTSRCCRSRGRGREEPGWCIA